MSGKYLYSLYIFSLPLKTPEYPWNTGILGNDFQKTLWHWRCQGLNSKFCIYCAVAQNICIRSSSRQWSKTSWIFCLSWSMLSKCHWTHKKKSHVVQSVSVIPVLLDYYLMPIMNWSTTFTNKIFQAPNLHLNHKIRDFDCQLKFYKQFRWQDFFYPCTILCTVHKPQLMSSYSIRLG
jgi:hypothetical protein